VQPPARVIRRDDATSSITQPRRFYVTALMLFAPQLALGTGLGIIGLIVIVIIIVIILRVI
jgi:hypothetical protein